MFSWSSPELYLNIRSCWKKTKLTFNDYKYVWGIIMLATSHTQIHSIFKILLLGIIFYFLEQKRGSKRLNNLFGATRLLNIDSTFIFVPSVLKFRNICLLPNLFFWERTYDAIKLIFPSPGSLTAISLSLLLGLHLICLHSAPWDQIQWFQHTFYGATLCVWLCALSTLWFLFFLFAFWMFFQPTWS